MQAINRHVRLQAATFSDCIQVLAAQSWQLFKVPHEVVCLCWAGDRLTLQQQAAFVGHFPMSAEPDDPGTPRRVIAIATSCAAAGLVAVVLLALGAQQAHRCNLMAKPLAPLHARQTTGKTEQAPL